MKVYQSFLSRCKAEERKVLTLRIQHGLVLHYRILHYFYFNFFLGFIIEGIFKLSQYRRSSIQLLQQAVASPRSVISFYP